MKTLLRHLIILALFACALSISASAQGGSSLTLDGSSFRLEQTDALGGVNIDPIGKDRSNRACFRLKISLNRMRIAVPVRVCSPTVRQISFFSSPG